MCECTMHNICNFSEIIPHVLMIPLRATDQQNLSDRIGKSHFKSLIAGKWGDIREFQNSFP